jgi:hypothetical protein
MDGTGLLATRNRSIGGRCWTGSVVMPVRVGIVVREIVQRQHAVQGDVPGPDDCMAVSDAG